MQRAIIFKLHVALPALFHWSPIHTWCWKGGARDREQEKVDSRNKSMLEGVQWSGGGGTLEFLSKIDNEEAGRADRWRCGGGTFVCLWFVILTRN